jgi:hypothetical protein
VITQFIRQRTEEVQTQLLEYYSAIHPPLRLPPRTGSGVRADVGRHFREIGYKDIGRDMDTIEGVFEWFKSGFERQIGGINADPWLNKAQQAAARRAFYEEALKTTSGAMAPLRFVWPLIITPTERCLVIILAFFRRLYLHLCRHELRVWIAAGGQGLRRRSI